MPFPIRCRPDTVLACLVPLVLAGAAAAAAPRTAPDLPDVDRFIHVSLRYAINYGVDLYNRGDVEGCYQHFRTVLEALAPTLSHHPDLRTRVEEGLRAVEKDAEWRIVMAGQVKVRGRPVLPEPQLAPEDRQKAFALRAILDEVRDAVEPGRQPLTLWDRLGGEKVVRKVAADLLTAAEADPRVNLDRGGKYRLDALRRDQFQTGLVALLSEATGGPLKYEGKGMEEVHRLMDITEEEHTAFLDHLQSALTKNGIKPTEGEAIVKIVAETRKQIVATDAAPELIRVPPAELRPTETHPTVPEPITVPPIEVPSPREG